MIFIYVCTNLPCVFCHVVKLNALTEKAWEDTVQCTVQNAMYQTKLEENRSSL